MLLKNLIKNSPKSLEKLKIKGLALNSKDVKKGFIFFAVKGNQSNGENYINDAIKNGAIVIICSKSCKFQSTKVHVIKTKKVRKYLSEITSKFYKQKPKNIKCYLFNFISIRICRKITSQPGRHEMSLLGTGMTTL